MDKPITPAAVRSRALAARITLTELLRRADVQRSSFSRWERGMSELHPVTAGKLADALDAIEAERAAA